MPTVIDGIKQYLAEHPDCQVHILSAYLKDSPYALDEKNQWLDQYLPEIDAAHRIFCPCGESKSQYIKHGIRNTDILLDDYTKNLLDWKAQGGIGVKLLNGINHTRGTWKGICVDNQNDDINLALQDVIKTMTQGKEYNKVNSVIEINKENFPDDVFRWYLSEQFGTVLTQETIQNTKELDLTPIGIGKGPSPRISDLTGIEYFVALEKLECFRHNLTKLNISNNPALIELNCFKNKLQELDISNNLALAKLNGCGNNLQKLDISNNPALTILYLLSALSKSRYTVPV